MKKGLLVLSFLVLNVFSVFAMVPPAYGRSFLVGNRLISFLPFIIVLVILIILISSNAKGRIRGGTALVLKEFKLNENEDDFLKIVGRASGLLGWILSLFGIEPITSLSCNKKSIKFEKVAIKNGKNTLNVSLASVSGVYSGINKPFALLVFGIIFIFGGLFGSIAFNNFYMFFLALIIGAVFIIFYYLKKTMTFGVYCGGDKPIATICIKKSIIEGQSIDESKYEFAAKALLQAVLNCKK